MLRTLTALAVGLLAGAVTVYLLTRGESAPADAVVRDMADVPKLSAAAAEQQRTDYYADVETVEDAMALPTEFAQLEALFVLAGRSDPGAVQALIFEANRIADDIVREQALGVLFYRLAELDAPSALALARTDYFRGLRSLEDTVWKAWARQDLDEALVAAKSQTTGHDQKRAAQSLFAAFGYLGNETTDRIEAELDIGPDRSTRARYLYRLADRSPEEAIRYVEGLNARESVEAASWLAYHLGRSEPALAQSLAARFDDPRLEQSFRSAIQNNVARREPRAVLDDILASGRAGDRQGEFISAIHTLAAEDVDAALAYFDRLGNEEDRRFAGLAIAEKLAEEDPRRALAWARANELPGDFSRLEMSVLMRIAHEDPEFALAEAQRSTDRRVRMNHVSSIFSQIADDDPQRAIAMAEKITDRQLREQATHSAVSHWISDDAEAALDWILSQDDAEAAVLLARESWTIVSSDVDTAIRVLDRVPEMQRRNMQLQIAQELATRRSPAEAQAFVQRFEGEPNYPQLQATVISAMAESNPEMALQMTDRLADRTARNTAYAAIIGQEALRDPRAAAGLLSLIDDESYLGTATGQIASQWYASEPEAAMRWVASLPSGAQRDDAVMHMASAWQRPTQEQQALVDSIADDGKRGQAKLRMIYSVMQTDPERARALLEDPDIPEAQRQQLELHFRNAGYAF